jgi:hypothetical protein
MDIKGKIALYIDPPSHHFLGDQLFNSGRVAYGGDQLMAPYVYLRDFFISRGVTVHTADYIPEAAGETQIVYVSIGNLKNYPKLAQRNDIILSGLIALECPIVEPALYRGLKKASRYFRRLFSWSDSNALEPFVGAPLDLTPIRWPQSFDEVHEEIWQRDDRKFLVMINSNKLPRIYRNELYTERLRAVEFFGNHREIDLYGVGWNEPPYRLGKTWVPYTLKRFHRKLLHYWLCIHPDNQLEEARRVYKGVADSKSKTLGSYTFALCFENMILKGWITEKIFDCFFAGTIPIYWGAPDIEAYVPPECFIDMRRFDSYEKLRTLLKSLNKKDVEKYKQNARNYLKSAHFRQFSKDAFVDLFRKIVEEDAHLSLN